MADLNPAARQVLLDLADRCERTPLLDWIPAHQRHSPTSKAAAEAIKPRVGPLHREILSYLARVEFIDGIGATFTQSPDGIAVAFGNSTTSPDSPLYKLPEGLGLTLSNDCCMNPCCTSDAGPGD